jgi:hypothetical protein
MGYLSKEVIKANFQAGDALDSVGAAWLNAIATVYNTLSGDGIWIDRTVEPWVLHITPTNDGRFFTGVVSIDGVYLRNDAATIDNGAGDIADGRIIGSHFYDFDRDKSMPYVRADHKTGTATEVDHLELDGEMDCSYRRKAGTYGDMIF